MRASSIAARSEASNVEATSSYATFDAPLLDRNLLILNVLTRDLRWYQYLHVRFHSAGNIAKAEPRVHLTALLTLGLARTPSICLQDHPVAGAMVRRLTHLGIRTEIVRA